MRPRARHCAECRRMSGSAFKGDVVSLRRGTRRPGSVQFPQALQMQGMSKHMSHRHVRSVLLKSALCVLPQLIVGSAPITLTLNLEAMLNGVRAVANVCRPSSTSGCDMRDGKGACCVDKKSADKEGGRVCETGVSSGDAASSVERSRGIEGKSSTSTSGTGGSKYNGGGPGERSFYGGPTYHNGPFHGRNNR
jgi:hypothetical protein